ncbi:hypothetical protein OMP38_03235 [Cohnella ginsengisoli]|uniref:Uncharacterized protein n=1 Tax=Cohnella ginsengisoli TaxID=425004 RepID=A0A9X4KH42_9BACL|nr:hypothetical protein [Cohnella ginsengisoli]MDG0789977.1 hypothetical protein [Cohnella ginsengisoli]
MRFAVRQKLLAIKPKVPPHDAVKGYLLRNSVNTIVNRLQAKLPSKTFNFFRQGNLAAAQYNILGMPSKIVYGSSKDIDDAHIKAVFAPLRTVRKFDHVSANKSRDIYVGMKAEGGN